MTYYQARLTKRNQTQSILEFFDGFLDGFGGVLVTSSAGSPVYRSLFLVVVEIKLISDTGEEMAAVNKLPAERELWRTRERGAGEGEEAGSEQHLSEYERWMIERRMSRAFGSANLIDSHETIGGGLEEGWKRKRSSLFHTISKL